MALIGNEVENKEFDRINRILISQPKPANRLPYQEIERKFNLTIDFRPFTQNVPVFAKDFRKQKIRPDEFTAVVFNSKHAVDHYFRLCDEMRLKVSQDMKYFCTTEAIALYLQKFIVFRKRKVFAGTKSIHDLAASLKKHSKEKYLIPCNDQGAKSIVDYLKELGIEYQEAIMYNTENCDLLDLRDETYDLLVFFSPIEIRSLFENFPDFKQNNTRIAVFGVNTGQAVDERGLHVDINAPVPEAPSMTMAIELYLQKSNSQTNIEQ
ncbi:MAG: uroporphyrinogen-III synthase [Saprospiraceae bacterium]|nr:uroporphyrinogen-III synthase [Saprospiraceae bacterium]